MAAPLQPRRWVEFSLEPYPSIGSPSNTVVYRWAARPLAGEEFIEGRVAAGGWENITRKASTASGEYNIDSASVVIEDNDALVRALLSDMSTRWFLNREAAFNLLSSTAFAAGLEPRLLFGGRCTDVQVLDGRTARLEFEDILAPYMDKEWPQYTLGDAYPYRFDVSEEVAEDLHEVDPGLQIPLALRDQPLPIYYGPFIDSAEDAVNVDGPESGSVRTKKGMCPVFFMGYTFLSAGSGDPGEPTPEMAKILTGREANWGGWGELCFAHGEYDIPNVYITDLGETPKRKPANEEYGITLLAPGHPGWPFPTNYVMRNGLRCTVLYARGPILWHHIVGLVNITVDTCGRKNSDGVAVTQAGFVYQHFLSEYVLAHDGAGYTSGPDAGLPLFGDGRAKFWTSQIQAWQDMTAERLGTDDGYMCSMALVEKTTLRQILSNFHVTFDCFTAKNAAGQLYMFGIDDLQDATEGVPIREFIELKSLPAPRIAWDEIENSIDYTVGWDPDQKTARTPTLHVQDEYSIAALKEERKPQGIRALLYTADDNTATDVISRRLTRLKQPPRYQPLPVGTGGVDRFIGEQVRVTHRDGIGPAGVGYSLTPMVIMEHVHQGDEITMVALDKGPIVDAMWLWADDDVPNYDSASDEQQALYGYWGDESSTVGAGNDPAKGWA